MQMFINKYIITFLEGGVQVNMIDILFVDVQTLVTVLPFLFINNFYFVMTHKKSKRISQIEIV